MQKICIRKSKVSSQTYSTHFIGDACFNNIVATTFYHFCVLLCHMGFHRNTVICLKIATSLKKSQDCSTMSIYNTKMFQ